MPIYEYKCQECGEVFDKLLRSTAAKAEVEKREAEEEALRQKRAAEREAMGAKRAPGEDDEEMPHTAAKIQVSALDKMICNLDRIHRRI